MDDNVFKALADPTRRLLLDALFQDDGRTLKELQTKVAMTRFGVMKHLRVLEEAGLVITQKSGRGTFSTSCRYGRFTTDGSASSGSGRSPR